MANSLQPRGLQPARLLCPWDSPDQNTGVGCHFLLQGVFLTQGLSPGLLRCRQILYLFEPPGASFCPSCSSLLSFLRGLFVFQGAAQTPPVKSLLSACWPPSCSGPPVGVVSGSLHLWPVPQRMPPETVSPREQGPRVLFTSLPCACSLNWTGFHGSF